MYPWVMNVSAYPERHFFSLTHSILRAGLLAAAVGFWLARSHAANLLVNPSFEQNSGHTIPSGWTRFAPPTAQSFGNYWIEGIVTPQAGSLYYKEWGAS